MAELVAEMEQLNNSLKETLAALGTSEAEIETIVARSESQSDLGVDVPGTTETKAPEAPPSSEDADGDFADDFSPDGVLLQRGGTGPAGEPVVADGERELRDPCCYLVAHNIKSADNLGSLVRTAGAFGAREVLVVSAERTSKRLRKNLRTFGAHGAERRVPLRAFGTLELLVSWAKAPPRNCEIFGIEIDDVAVSCAAPDAFGAPALPACFMPGNEGEGLLPNQIALCDRLVYVPQFAPATASLNVNAATAVVLSWYAAAAGYAEERRSGNKYDVVDPLHKLWKPKPPPAEPPAKEGQARSPRPSRSR